VDVIRQPVQEIAILTAEAVHRALSSQDLWPGAITRSVIEDDSIALELCRPLLAPNGVVTWRRSAIIIPAVTPSQMPGLIPLYLNEWNMAAILLAVNEPIAVPVSWTQRRLKVIDVTAQPYLSQSAEDTLAEARQFLDPDFSAEAIDRLLDDFTQQIIDDPDPVSDFSDEDLVTFVDAVITSASFILSNFSTPFEGGSHVQTTVGRRAALKYDPEAHSREVTIDFSFLHRIFGQHRHAIQLLAVAENRDSEQYAFSQASVRLTRSLAEFAIRMLYARSFEEAIHDITNQLPGLRVEFLETLLLRTLTDASIVRKDTVFALIQTFGFASPAIQAALIQLAQTHAVTTAVPAIRLLGYFQVQPSRATLATLASDRRKRIRQAAQDALSNLDATRDEEHDSRISDFSPSPSGTMPVLAPSDRYFRGPKNTILSLTKMGDREVDDWSFCFVVTHHADGTNDMAMGHGSFDLVRDVAGRLDGSLPPLPRDQMVGMGEAKTFKLNPNTGIYEIGQVNLKAGEQDE
jgi:hypothetical protein